MNVISNQLGLLTLEHKWNLKIINGNLVFEFSKVESIKKNLGCHKRVILCITIANTQPFHCFTSKHILVINI